MEEIRNHCKENGKKRDGCLFQVYKIINNLVTDGQIDHPVHEMEGEEGYWEHNPTVLVNITGLKYKELLYNI